MRSQLAELQKEAYSFKFVKDELEELKGKSQRDALEMMNLSTKLALLQKFYDQHKDAVEDMKKRQAQKTISKDSDYDSEEFDSSQHVDRNSQVTASGNAYSQKS